MLNGISEVEYVDTPERLSEFLRALDEHSTIAIDTEFIREKTYYPQLCLIQIAAGNSIWCIDALALDELSAFYREICNPSRIKVFHAGRQDLEIFFHETAQIPAPIFDTQIAAALLGRPDQIGYAALVTEFYHIELDKSSSRTNWARRPLTDRQLDYAANDVRYLLGIKDKLTEELYARGRSDWLAEECCRLVDTKLYKSDPANVWRRIKGVAKLMEAEKRNIAVGLASWREIEAQKRNLPRGWVLKDDRLVAISQAAPSSDDQLHAISGLAPSFLRRYGRKLLKVIRVSRTGVNVSDECFPRRLTTAGKKLLGDLLKALKRCAEDNSISGNMIASRKDLELAICGQVSLRLYEGWRNNLFGKVIRRQIASASSKMFE